MHNRLFYTEPAKNWNEALPIGNGRLGAMIFGGLGHEQLALNEETMYYGEPRDRMTSKGPEAVEKARQLIKEERLFEAYNYVKMALNGRPRYEYPYQPLGDLYVNFLEPHCSRYKNVEGYKRELDLERGLSTVEYTIDGCTYRREYFSTAPDDVICIRYSASERGKISFNANLMRRPFDPGSVKMNKSMIIMKGTLGHKGITYNCACDVTIEGKGRFEIVDDVIHVEDADAVVLKLASYTSFNQKLPHVKSENVLMDLKCQTFEELLARHETDYKELYSRVELTIPEIDKESIPTNKRLQLVKDGANDPGLIPLYFNYGRYLLIACSRPGTLAANLQGIWNANFTPSWESTYTININLQMNYWMAESCNLSECHEPLFDLIASMLEKGRKMARDMYGCDGFVAHHRTSPWGDCEPSGMNVFLWPFGAAWLCLHLWEHYAYTMDKVFLEEKALPIIKEAIIFFRDYLIEDEDGYLITGMTQSPENTYELPNGERSSLCLDATMDHQILTELFKAGIGSCEALNKDTEFKHMAEGLLNKIRPNEISSDGRIKEWHKEYKETELGHRHISHLFGLYPGKEISLEKTPELAAAAKKTIETRLANGGGHTGWSRAWLINYFANLMDGDTAYKHIQALFSLSTYNNLFDSHPPFQIDGNFGGTAGITQLFLQSKEDGIYVLPALPSALPEGEVKGLRAFGGFEIDLTWQMGNLKTLTIHSLVGGVCRVVCHNKAVELDTEANHVYTLELKDFE